MAEAELLWQNLSSAEKFLFLMPNSEPTEMSGAKLHLLSVLLQHAHTREAWRAFLFSPVPPQGRNWEEKRFSPTLLPNSKHLGSWGDLVMNLWRAGYSELIRSWIVGETMHHHSIEQTLFSRTLIVIVSSTEASQTAAANLSFRP